MSTRVPPSAFASTPSGPSVIASSAGRIGQHDDADLGALQRFGRRGEHRDAPLGELGGRPGRAVPDEELVARSLEPARDRRAHPSQSENSDPHRV